MKKPKHPKRKFNKKSKRSVRKKIGYPSDLSQSQWRKIRHLFPRRCRVGRPAKWLPKFILNAIFYILRTGCQWRYLPNDFPHWKTVYYYFRKWSDSGFIEKIHNVLRDRLRQKLGRNKSPSRGIIDSQSAKTCEQGGERGYDAGKKIKGRKRHIVVDCLGFLLTVHVGPANIQDRDGPKPTLEKLGKVYYDPNVPVHTAWDLGYNDSTAIWFFQQCGQEIHLLEYYENSGEALTHYLHHLKSKPYTYGKHLVPHDAAVHEYSTGLSRVEVARNHGITFTIAPDIGINEGIDAARNILPRCWFDEEKCAKGISSLDNYKKEWNDRHGCWSSRPLHNFASHGADAFRMLAMGIGKLVSKGLSAEDWRELRLQYI